MHANDTPPTRSGQDTRSGKATYHTGVKGAAPKAMMRLALGSAALQISKEESEFHGRRKEALANAEKRRELLATIAEQRGLAEQALTDLESRHKRSALKRFLGETKDTLRDEIAAARERCAELDDAAVQAGVEIELFEKDAAGFARLAEIVRGVLIARERKLLCCEIAKVIDQLRPLCFLYRVQAASFIRVLRYTGNHVGSSWRLGSVIDGRLFGRAQTKEMRVENLGAVEAQLFYGVIAKTLREEFGVPTDCEELKASLMSGTPLVELLDGYLADTSEEP
jgi:hypothetical protein